MTCSHADVMIDVGRLRIPSGVALPFVADAQKAVQFSCPAKCMKVVRINNTEGIWVKFPPNATASVIRACKSQSCSQCQKSLTSY